MGRFRTERGSGERRRETRLQLLRLGRLVGTTVERLAAAVQLFRVTGSGRLILVTQYFGT